MTNNPESKPSPNDRVDSEQHGPYVTADHQITKSSANATPGAQSNLSLSFYHRNKAVIEPVIALLALIGALAGGFVWLEAHIDQTVEHKLSDPVILRKIAQESRPVLIFNADESIVADEGASQFIKELKITSRESISPTNMNLPAHVHIEFTKFFVNSPIVTPVTQFLGVATGKRGKGFSWEFDFTWGGYTPGQDSEHQLFRLELLP
jgi:hypothetical protein